MLKLLVVTPNPTVYDATVRIVQTTKFDAEVIQTTSRQVVEDVSKAMEGCTGIVVARGNQAQLLKKHVEYPVSEITFSGQEMAGFVKQACDLIPHKHPKIAFVGFRHMYYDGVRRQLGRVHPRCAPPGAAGDGCHQSGAAQDGGVLLPAELLL